ncbi:pentatricopeptide repeat-containing protein At4g20090-like [Phragmites australis]|uniref:pentatricopeptide repeat-containing protein At4g20090-like n=1 Tax=Phragmites australis TaxID=29695 RepID=UPI002D799911|nr:pentatricopeptide repeat-containing protein At4g20090-like [Phragmites australis]XP_062232962.1 pentatricopeptide repeat-containing protein At4g20090-like [Phragmites australis]
MPPSASPLPVLRLARRPSLAAAAAARRYHSAPTVSSSSSSDDESPLAAELFPAAGAPTLLSIARSLAVASPSPSVASVLGFLRRLPHDASPHIFPHLVAALARSPAPLLALRLFLSPPNAAATTHHSFNSALFRFPLPPHLLPAFFSHSLRRFPGLAPTLLSFNLLLKCVSSSLVPRNPSIYLAITMRILHDCIPARNLVPDKFTYSTVVSALADAGRVEDAVALVHEMVVDGVVAAEAFNPVLRAMLRTGDVTGAAKLFRFMQLKGCTMTAATYNVLLHGLLLCGKARAATGVMRKMEKEGVAPGLMTYGAVVDGLVKCGRVEDAWKVAEEMGSKGLAPSEFVYSAVISGFCKSGEVDRALRVWETMVAGRVRPNVVLYSAMIDGLARCRRMKEAEMLFGEMVDAKCIPNVMTYSSMVQGYFHIGDLSRALSFWEEMLKVGCAPNAISYSILINGLCNVGRLKDAMMVWKHMLDRGCAPDTIAYTSIIKGLCMSGMVDGGLRLFYDMLAKDDAKPDAISYNVLLDGLIRAKDFPQAMDLLNRMLDQRCDPDTVTCNIFLREIGIAEGKGREFLEGLVMRLCNRERYRAAGDVVMLMLAKYIVPEVSIWFTVVRGVCHSKRVRKVFDKCWDEIWRP